MKRSIFTGYLFLGLFCFGLQAEQANSHVIDNLKLNFQDLFSSEISEYECELIINDLKPLEDCLKNGFNPNLVIESKELARNELSCAYCHGVTNDEQEIQDEMGDMIDKETHNFVTPLYLAIKSAKIDAAKLLLKYGAKPNEAVTDRHVLELIVNDVELLEECLKKGLNPNLVIEFTNKSGRAVLAQYWIWAPTNDVITPLYIAVDSANVDAVKLLLKYGANPHGTFHDREGYFSFTLLYEAVRGYCDSSYMSISETMQHRIQTFKIMKALLKAGADPNVLSFWTIESTSAPHPHSCDCDNCCSPVALYSTNNGLPLALYREDFLPLYDAVERGYDWMIELLLEAGANPHQACTSGWVDGKKIEKTSFDLALEKGNANIINLFVKYGFTLI